MDYSFNKTSDREKLPLLGATSTRRSRPFTTSTLPMTNVSAASATGTTATGNPNSKAPITGATGTGGASSVSSNVAGTVAGGGAAGTILTKNPNTKISRPLALDTQRQTFQKQTRPRKAVADFLRKKTTKRSAGPPVAWSGRVGIHLHVDEIDIEQIATKIGDANNNDDDENNNVNNNGGMYDGQNGDYSNNNSNNKKQKSPPSSSALAGWNAVHHFEVVRLWQTPTSAAAAANNTLIDWPLSEDEQDPLMTTAKDNNNMTSEMMVTLPEIYLFSFGACVFWNFASEQEEKDWISKVLLGELDEYCGDLYKEDEIESAMDSVSFQYSQPQQPMQQQQQQQQQSSDMDMAAATPVVSAAAPMPFTIKQDVCTLSTRDPGEKLAVSFALAKSSLLSLYELRVQDIIERNSSLPEEMAKDGRVHMSMDDLSREVGRLFLVKHGINLDQSLIDTPEEFWEDDRFESTYDTTLKYLKIGKRLDLVNNRLDMIGELHAKIMEENHTHHAVILEWIIIVLIVVEVLLDMLHLGFY